MKTNIKTIFVSVLAKLRKIPILSTALLLGIISLIIYLTRKLDWGDWSFNDNNLIFLAIAIMCIYLLFRWFTKPKSGTTTTPASSTPKKSWLSGVRGGVIVISFLMTVIILGLFCFYVVEYAWNVFTTKEETLTVQCSNATAFELIEDYNYEFSVVETNGEVAIPDQKFIITDPIGYKKVQTGNKLPVRIAPFPPDGYVTPPGDCKVKLVNGNSAKIKLTQVPSTEK